MKIDILTIFPDFFASPLKQSLLGKAIDKGVIDVKIWNIRDFATDIHKTVDDTPYGGGFGMVMKIEPLCNCLDFVISERGDGYKILMTPKGRTLKQHYCEELSNKHHLIIICGRYEGIDERIAYFIDDQISVGDYVLMGGEVAALIVLEASVRLVKGVIGREESFRDETFCGDTLEYPQYTKPNDFKGYKVPEVLLSGNHKKIAEWRKLQSDLSTSEVRPDLVVKKNTHGKC